MALFQCRFFSEVLGLSTSMTVILPEPAKSQIGMSAKGAQGPYPTLYLLHGMSDDDTVWLRRTSIERYVSGMGLAVIMPQVDLSFYTDMAEGNRYWTFVSEELPRLCRSFSRCPDAGRTRLLPACRWADTEPLSWPCENPRCSPRRPAYPGLWT